LRAGAGSSIVGGMSACSRCQTPTAPADLLFSTNGDALCKRCFFADQTAAQDRRAAESLAAEHPGLQPAAEGNATTSILAGAGLMGLSILWFFVGIFLANRIYFYPFFLFVVGFAALARGLALRRRS
jgi:hypothetical protein